MHVAGSINFAGILIEQYFFLFSVNFDVIMISVMELEQ
jgi:hypothetical protein